MTSWMTSHQRWQWQTLLELKLRRSHGDAFQDFFSSIMGRLHRDDFVRVRPFGRKGDKGCDGYLKSSGQLFQCYGKLDDGSVNVAYLVSKMGEDYGKAAVALASIMKEWHFVHNLVDGVPVEALLKIEELEKANTHQAFGMIGPEGIEERVFALAEADVVELLGPAATAEETQNLRVDEVGDLIRAVMRGIDDAPIDAGDIKPVPSGKLSFNALPAHWHHMVMVGSQNAIHIEDYFRRHPNPELGERVASVFRVRYGALKVQRLPPAAIMTALYESITGVGSVSPQRQVAAQALLAYLFDACDIFEDDPATVTE